VGNPGQTRGLIQTDIFRVANGKIIEHWDILPSAPTS
jgi:predicted SnoaL-like aldol condensation-catalyzing enzyme